VIVKIATSTKRINNRLGIDIRYRYSTLSKRRSPPKPRLFPRNLKLSSKMTTAFAGPLVVGTQFSRFVKFESRFAPSSHLPKTMLLKRLNRSFKTRRSFGAAPSLSVFIMANANNNGGDSKDGGASTPPNASSMPPSASSKGFEAKLEYVWNLFEKAEEDKKLLYLHEYNILLERMTKAQEDRDNAANGKDNAAKEVEHWLPFEQIGYKLRQSLTVRSRH